MSMKFDLSKIKEVIKSLNNAKYDSDGKEVSFLETGIKISIGESVESLGHKFAKAIEQIMEKGEDVASELPEDIIDFYNQNDFPAEEPVSKAKDNKEEETVKKKETVKKETVKKETVKKETVKKTGKKKEPAELSVFGHKGGSQAAKLDALLAPGKSISLDELVKGSGRSELGVKSHIKHLINDRKLTINEKDGVYRYVKNASK